MLAKGKKSREKTSKNTARAPRLRTTIQSSQPARARAHREPQRSKLPYKQTLSSFTRYPSTHPSIHSSPTSSAPIQSEAAAKPKHLPHPEKQSRLYTCDQERAEQ